MNARYIFLSLAFAGFAQAIMRTSIIAMLLSLVITSQADEITANELRGILQSTAQLTGTNYIRQRNDIVSSGTNIIPILRQLQATNEPLEVQLMAGICRERLEREDDIKAMATKDWRKDSGWEKNWDYVTTLVPTYSYSVEGECKKLMVKRYREAGLWNYYIELFWKNTGETPNVGPDMNAREWNDLSLTVLEGSPVIELVARVMEDAMIKGGGWCYPWVEYLIGNKMHSSLPVLMDLWPQCTNSQAHDNLDFKILTLATTNDISLLSSFMEKNKPKLDVNSADRVERHLRSLKPQ